MSGGSPCRPAPGRGLAALSLLALAGCRAGGADPFPPSRGPGRDAVAASAQQGWEGLEERTFGDAEGLDACLALARRENRGLRAAEERWRAAAERAPQVSSFADPTLTWRHFIEEVQTRTGPQRFQLELMQRLPRLGERGLAAEHAEVQALAARARLAQARLELDLEVRRAWYEHYLHERSLRVVRRWRELAEQRVDVLRAAYSAGGATYADLLRADVELGRLQVREETLVDHGRPILARLNATMNRPSDAAVPVPDQLEDPPAPFPHDALLALQPLHNPELAELRLLRRAAALRLSLARLERRPDVEVGVGYVDTDDALAPGVAGSGDDPLFALVRFELPIRRARYAAAEREAEAAARAAALELEDRERDLFAELEETLFRVRNADRRVALYLELLVPRAEEAFTTVESAYRAGTVGFLDLVDAERTLFELELELDRARTEREVLVAEAERLVGRPITGIAGTPGPP